MWLVLQNKPKNTQNKKNFDFDLSHGFLSHINMANMNQIRRGTLLYKRII